jgi:indole-3-glycerol phosphate synthase
MPDRFDPPWLSNDVYAVEYMTSKGVLRKDFAISHSQLYDIAKGGSGAVREFLLQILNEQLLEPLLDKVLEEMVEREESDKRLYGILSRSTGIDEKHIKDIMGRGEN